MKKFILTSIFCTFAIINNSSAAENVQTLPAQENACAGFEKIRPRLRLRSSYGRLRYNRDYDTLNLGLMSEREGLKEDGMFTAGFSTVDFDWSVSLNTVSRTSGDVICVIPASVEVFLGYQNPTIYLSSDLDDKTCQYQTVLRHERQHQQINIMVLDYYLPKLKQHFEENLKVLKARAVESEKDIDRTVDEMNETYVENIRDIVNRFQITLQLEQKRLDTRENYTYESGLCR
ncbi:MAG: hypothetical protein IJ689_06660 [Alphaproteobacteria bacterium]|nr:hypothetical protein [Alphaproteobacteria bacterium]